VEPLVAGLLGKQASEGALEIWAVDSALGGHGSDSGSETETAAAVNANANAHEWQTLCIWGGPCSGAGGSDSWQIMVQMLRVAGAERLLPKTTGRPPIFQRTLNFVIALAHNMDYVSTIMIIYIYRYIVSFSISLVHYGLCEFV
jgi:hypothetical protein